MASSPDAGAFLGDEALDGSGSGDSPVWRHGKGEIDDDEDDHDDAHDDDGASGSGMGPITSGTVSPQAIITSALICISIIEAIRIPGGTPLPDAGF